MPERSLLAVFAHPDDESFLCGGALARYAAAGMRVVLACATRGEAGEISDPTLATPDNLGTVRARELHDAAVALGLEDPQFLGFHDGTLSTLPFPEGVETVARLIAATRPQVVLTFGPEGVYGHPDHVTVHRWTKQAFHEARQSMANPDTDASPAATKMAPSRLYYCAPPRSWYRAISERCRTRGVPDRYGRRLDWLGVPDVLVTTCLQVGSFAPQKLLALRAHRTQLPAVHPFLTLPDADLHELLGVEWYTRAWPPLPPETPAEDDLLDGRGADD